MAAARFAMPIGLPPANIASVATHFEQLRTRFQSELLPTNRIATWVADEPLYSGTHAMTRCLLLWVPAGSADFLGRTQSAPLLVLRIWASEYLKLRQLAGRAAPKFVVYRGLEESEVRSALQTFIGTQPRLATQAAVVLTQVMAGQSKLLLASGTRIGRGTIDSVATDPARALMRRVDMGFEDDLGDPLDVGQSLDLWRLTGDELVVGHPMLDAAGGCRPSVAPVEGRTMLKLRLANALPPGPFQVLVDNVAAIEQLAGAGGTTIYFRAPPHASGYVDVSLIDANGGRANFAGALRYSEDYDTAWRAMAESFVIGLDCVEDVMAAATPSVEVVGQLERIADLEGHTWRELLNLRATATSSAAWTPDFQRFSDQLAQTTQGQVERVADLLKAPGTPLFPASLPDRRFDGATFFADIRPLMDANRGMFVARESDIAVYVCVDATFHRFRVLERDRSKVMSHAMLELMAVDPMVRAIASGQYFARTRLDYIYTRPSPLDPKRSDPRGQYIVDGTLAEDDPYPIGAVGQTAGRGEAAFVISRAQPGLVTTPSALWQALSGEVLISGGVGRPGLIGDKNLAPRVVYGVHRASNTLFFFATSRLASFASIGARMIAMGVDDAAQLDGGSSAMLGVDGSLRIDETLGWYKDFSMPLAGYFRLDERLDFDGTAMVAANSTDPAWPALTTIQGVFGSVRVSGTGGLDLAVDDFGSGLVGSVVRDVAPGMNATLHVPTMLLKTPQNFVATPPASGISARLKFESGGTATDHGRLVGQINFQNAGGQLVLDVLLTIVTP